jgi:hypothetical protein
MVSFEEARVVPEASVRARADILKAVYGGDYRTDIDALSRLAESVRAGRERIFFWGEAEAIKRWRAACQHASSAAAPESEVPELGTASLLDRSTLFGAGVWELSRTGSVARRSEATVPNMIALAEHMVCQGERPGSHAIYSTPRTRALSDQAPSGVAVHRMHVRELRSTFLGVAPWYRMQGNVVEVLDFRALFPDRSRVERLVAQAPPAFLHARSGRAFFEAMLCAGKLAAHLLDDVGGSASGETIRFGAGFGLHPGENNLQPLFVSPVERDGATVHEALATLSDAPSCTIFRVPLVATTGLAQAALEARGFSFCAAELPYAPGSPWIGHWCRVTCRLPVMLPYYLERPLPNRHDAAIAAAVHTVAVSSGWLNHAGSNADN